MSPSIATLAKATRVGLSAARTSEIERRARADHQGMAVAVCAALGPDDDAVDVGAHDGRFTRRMTDCAPGGRHLAVEPVPHHAEALRGSLPPTVIVEECALGARDGRGTMEFTQVLGPPTGQAPSASRAPDGPPARRFQRVRVPTSTLDALVELHDLRPRLVRIDVEGAELGVLAGARATIAEYRPWLMIEHGCAATAYNEVTTAFWEASRDLRLRIFDFDGNGPYDRAGFLRAVGPFGYFNFLLRP